MFRRLLPLLATMAASLTFAGLAKAGQLDTAESAVASADRIRIRRADGGQLEISVGRGDTWQPVERDRSVDAGWVVRWVEQGARPWVLVERTNRAPGSFPLPDG